MTLTAEQRIRNLKKMYKSYKAQGNNLAAQRVLAELKRQGLTDEQIDDLKVE